MVFGYPWWGWLIIFSLLFLLSTTIWWNSFSEYLKVKDASNLAKMRSKRLRLEKRAKKKADRQSMKLNRQSIAKASDWIATEGYAKTKNESLVKWFTEKGYDVVRESPYQDYYIISVPKMTDKELSDIMLK